MVRFRRVLSIFSLALSSIAALAQAPPTVPVTGNLAQILGTPTAYGGVKIQLQNCPTPSAVVGYNVIVQTGILIRADSQGLVNTTLVPNDKITCAGTTGQSMYAVTYVVNGSPGGTTQCYQVASTQSAWNLNTQQPITCTQPPPNPQDAQLRNINVTGCLSIDGSGCIGPLSAITIPNNQTPFSNKNTVSILTNFLTPALIVQCEDSNGTEVRPNSRTITPTPATTPTTYTVTVTFVQAQSGSCIVNGSGGTGGGSSGSVYGSGYFAYPGVNEFGDSITCGNGATGTQFWYANIIALAFGGIQTNYCQGGDQAADMAVAHVYPNLNPGYNFQPATTMMIGTNDADLCGPSTGCQNNFFHADLASVAWAAIPNQVKILFGSNTQAVTVNSGTWTPDSTLQTNLALSASSGASLTFTTITGSAAMYLGWMASDGDTATAALTCDGGALTDTLNAFGYNGQSIATGNGRTTTVFVNRYSFSTSGTHTCTVTANASAGNPFSIVWAGSPQPSTANPFAYPTASGARVFMGGVIRQQGGTNDAVNSIYNSLAQTIASQTASDGLNVAFVDTRNAVNTTTDFSGGTLTNGTTCVASTLPPVHPDNCGHQHLADAFIAVAQPVAAAFAIPPQLNLVGGSPSWVTVNSGGMNSRYTPNQLYMNSVGTITWSSTASSISSIIGGISFCGAQGAFCVGNGTNADFSANFLANNITGTGIVQGTNLVADETGANSALIPTMLELNLTAPVTWSNDQNSLVTKTSSISQLSVGSLGVGSGAQGSVDGAITLQQIRPSYTTEPTGSCASYPNGTLALSLDGHASSCNAGTWVQRW